MNSRKQGFSLIEMVVAVTVLSVVMTVTVTLVHRMLREQRTAQAVLERHRTIQRACDQFTRDVHAAEAVEWIPESEAGGWQLSLRIAPRRVVHWQCIQNRLDRVELADEVAVHREPYMLSTGCRLVAMPDAEDARFLRLDVWQNADRPDVVSRLLSRRRACIGRDRRHEIASLAAGIDP